MSSSYIDPVEQNVTGVRQLVNSDLNKKAGATSNEEGVIGDFDDVLSLKLSDDQLIEKSRKWEADYLGYEEKIKTRQSWNYKYLIGRQNEGNGERDVVVPSNLIFESTATFVPQALAKNPTPVVYPASNDPQGIILAKSVKTMLQYHADVQNLRRKLGQMVWHWSAYFLGALKHGWDTKVGDIDTDVVDPQMFILDENGTIDVYGNYTGTYLGQRRIDTAQDVIDMFEDDSNPQSVLTPEKKAYITASVDGKMGTRIGYTEWWTNEYCFYTYKGIVLDKHKNQFWNYDEPNSAGEDDKDNSIKGRNHFGRPKMPYTFLSVFSLGKNPHDFTNLIEQNIPNQDLVLKRIKQIDKNLDVSNNSLAVSAENFNNETAKQAADAMQDGRPIMVPRGKAISEAIMRMPADSFPSDAFDQLNDMTTRLRSIYGTLGSSPAGQAEDDTVRGKIIASQQDASRIGGGVGDSLEQVADNVFNWWVQLYYVFYDEQHFAAILGNDQAVQYITLKSSDINERIVVSVAPDSMKPHDEITEMNLATDQWASGAIDPLSYKIALNDPDPMDSAQKLVLWKLSPELYYQTYFPQAPQPVQPGAPQPQGGPTDTTPPSPPGSTGGPAPNPSLSQVPINSPGVPK